MIPFQLESGVRCRFDALANSIILEIYFGTTVEPF